VDPRSGADAGVDGLFLLFLSGQLLTGFAEYDSEQPQHGLAAVTLSDYLATGHLWEAVFDPVSN